MSLDAMDWVWTKSKSKGVGRLVMLALADKARPSQDDCKAYGSLSFLQQRANCTREAVTDAITALGKLGELEPVEGEKGPYGAAVYRLPRAIGHVRPEANRSAHPTDSDSAIGRLTRPGVVGSPDRFEAGSVGSPDHNTNPPPKTTTSAPTDPPATSPTGGGGGLGLEQAIEFLMQLPGDWACGRRTAHDLAQLLTERTTEQGWDFDGALIRELTKNPRNIGSFEAVLPHRIDNLRRCPAHHTRDSPRPAAVGLPAWCESEDCNPHTRMRTEPGGPNGYPVSEPCKACHPDMIKDTAA